MWTEINQKVKLQSYKSIEKIIFIFQKESHFPETSCFPNIPQGCSNGNIVSHVSFGKLQLQTHMHLNLHYEEHIWSNSTSAINTCISLLERTLLDNHKSHTFLPCLSIRITALFAKYSPCKNHEDPRMIDINIRSLQATCQIKGKHKHWRRN